MLAHHIVDIEFDADIIDMPEELANVRDRHLVILLELGDSLLQDRYLLVLLCE